MATWKQYLLALAIFSAFLTLRITFVPITEGGVPPLFLPISVILASWFCGKGPGILVASLSATFSIYVFYSSRNSSTTTDFFAFLLLLLAYYSTTYIICYIKHRSEFKKHWTETQRMMLKSLEELDSCSVVSFDSDGKVVTWNSGATKLFGYTAEEAEGLSWHKLFCGEDIRAGLPETIQAITQKKGAWTGEVWRVRKNGCKIWVTLLVIRLREGFQCICRDITHQKRLEESLERWKHIFDHGAWSVVVTDAQDNIMTHVNPAFAQMHGYVAEELVGKPIAVIFAPEFLSDLPKHIAAAQMGDDDYTYLSVHIKRNGQRFPVRTHVSVFKDDQGKPIYRAGILIDVTNERKLERQLRDKSEEARYAIEQKDDFVATLAHELRNPLSPIKTSLHVYRQSGRMDESTIELIARNVDQIQRLVDDLMDVTAIAKGKINLQKELVDLRDAIILAIEQSRALIKGKDHKLFKSLPTDPVFVDGDVSRLQQIFANLLNNAAKYTDEGGSIWITAEHVDSHVHVRIRDNGIGIASDMLESVFVRYSQAGAARDRSQGGLGIGLTLVKQLVDLHGGSIQVFSEGIGKGSTFLVRLPVVKSAPNLEVPPVKFHGDGVLQDRKILVVDDNIDAATSMQMMFAMDGSEVVVAHDGEEAVRVYEDFHPDIILLDIGLPKLDGYEVAQKIRSKDKNVTLIAVTGYGQPSDLERATQCGFDAHTIKPVEPYRFKKLVNTAFEERNTGRNHDIILPETI